MLKVGITELAMFIPFQTTIIYINPEHLLILLEKPCVRQAISC
jgi:hypothetical protein